MAHEDAGHYAAKHPGATVDTAIAEAIENRQNEGRISCAAAHQIAQQSDCKPNIVGQNIDLLEKRISKCQLGLFGYGAAKSKAVEAASTVAPDLEKAIREAMDGELISCEAAWKVAKQFDRTKLEVADACEGLGIKVSKCQLGAF